MVGFDGVYFFVLECVGLDFIDEVDFLVFLGKIDYDVCVFVFDYF